MNKVNTVDIFYSCNTNFFNARNIEVVEGILPEYVGKIKHPGKIVGIMLNYGPNDTCYLYYSNEDLSKKLWVKDIFFVIRNMNSYKEKYRINYMIEKDVNELEKVFYNATGYKLPNIKPEGDEEQLLNIYFHYYGISTWNSNEPREGDDVTGITLTYKKNNLDSKECITKRAFVGELITKYDEYYKCSKQFICTYSEKCNTYEYIPVSDGEAPIVVSSREELYNLYKELAGKELFKKKTRIYR